MLYFCCLHLKPTLTLNGFANHSFSNESSPSVVQDQQNRFVCVVGQVTMWVPWMWKHGKNERKHNMITQTQGILKYFTIRPINCHLCCLVLPYYLFLRPFSIIRRCWCSAGTNFGEMPSSKWCLYSCCTKHHFAKRLINSALSRGCIFPERTVYVKSKNASSVSSCRHER